MNQVVENSRDTSVEPRQPPRLTQDTSRRGRQTEVRTSRRRSGLEWWLEKSAPYVLVAPAVVLLVSLRLWPLALGVNYSFTGDGALSGQTVGLANYRELFGDETFQLALRNVGLLVLLLPIAVAIPGLLATFIHLRVPGHRIYRSVYFFPAVLSPVIVGAIFTLLLSFNGPVNSWLDALGVEPIDWLGNTSTAMLTVTAVHIWATFGMSLIVFLAGFATLDNSLLDAAKVDGASLVKQIWHVIIPSLSRTIQFVFVTTMIGLLTSMFALVYVMTSGGPAGSTYLPEFYIWMQQGQMNRPALASAASTVLFFIMMVVGLGQLALLNRSGKED